MRNSFSLMFLAVKSQRDRLSSTYVNLGFEFTTFTNNEAGQNGGAMYFAGPLTTFLAVIITGNRAFNGGGLYFAPFGI